MPAYKYTLKDGKTVRWYANFYYVDWTGAKHHVCKRGFATQREAREYERGFLDRARAGSSDIPFPSLVENYMADMGHRLKPSTMQDKEHLIRTKVLPYFEKLRACDIDAIKIRSWQNELLSMRKDDGEPYSPTYVRSIHNQMSAIMNYARKHYGIAANPCEAAGSIGKSHADEMLFWTRDEYARAISCERKSAYKLAFDVLFYTGIREGELLALSRDDVLPTRELRIHKTLASVHGVKIIQEAKTERSRRTVALPEFIYAEIEEYVAKIGLAEDGERIFMMTKSALDSEIKKIADAAGVKRIRVHDLRHSHASMLIDMEVGVLEISRRLGHESVKTTMDTYGHLYPNKDVILASRLDKERVEIPNPGAGPAPLTSP